MARNISPAPPATEATATRPDKSHWLDIPISNVRQGERRHTPPAAAHPRPTSDRCSTVSHMTLMTVVLVTAGALGLIFGLVEMIAPQFAIRWQVASTARRKGRVSVVGETFQRWYGADPSAGPWNDRRVKRLVRWTGLFVVGFSVIAIASGVSLSRH